MVAQAFNQVRTQADQITQGASPTQSKSEVTVWSDNIDAGLDKDSTLDIRSWIAVWTQRLVVKDAK